MSILGPTNEKKADDVFESLRKQLEPKPEDNPIIRMIVAVLVPSILILILFLVELAGVKDSKRLESLFFACFLASIFFGIVFLNALWNLIKEEHKRKTLVEALSFIVLAKNRLSRSTSKLKEGVNELKQDVKLRVDEKEGNTP